MKRSARLKDVLQLYQREEDSAAATYQAAQAAHDEQVQQLEQLLAYQTDYQRRMTTEARGSVTMAQWKRTQDYVAQLDHIIAHQEQEVAQADVRARQTEAVWQDAHLERRAMETMVERVVAQETREADRREQKALDELVQQMRRGPVR